MFEGCEIEIVPSATGSGDALDIETATGRRRMKILVDYLVVRLQLTVVHIALAYHSILQLCLDAVRRRKWREETDAVRKTEHAVAADSLD